MPIFEQDEVISIQEIRRQQLSLNAKVKRKEFAEQYDNLVIESIGHDGGDYWEDEPENYLDAQTHPIDPTFKIFRVGEWNGK